MVYESGLSFGSPGSHILTCIRPAFLAALTGALLGTGAASAQAPRLLESRESLYNNIYVFEKPPEVALTFGHNKKYYAESIFNTQDDRALPVSYTQYMTVALMYAKDVHSILEIGSGGGRTAWYLHRFLPDVRVTSVELDPSVAELSKKYFGIRDEPNFALATRDGRLFLSQSKEKYDIILLDAYRGPFVPFHLLTKEFYQIVKDHLAEGGVVAQNVETTTMLYDSAMKTIGTAFSQIETYKSDDNVVTVAYDGAERKADDLAAVAGARDKTWGLRYPLAGMLAERKRVDLNDARTIDAKAKVLTDDFAPVDTLKAVERHNGKPN
jgi:spermidine synthase